MTHRAIYLDHQATTPLDSVVYEAMQPYFLSEYGNPHSLNHIFGEAAWDAIEHAREDVAKIIRVKPSEIYFTSGATEANNLALFGYLQQFQSKAGYQAIHVITSAIEHSSILAPVAELERQGVNVTKLPVEKNGRLYPARLEAAIRGETVLVSIMTVNNETGVIQPIKELSEICHRRNLKLHTDLAQATGRMTMDMKGSNIAMASLSSHKMYGPKGIGALYISADLKEQFSPLIYGGGQERGLRSGTLPTPLCVGFGKACALADLQINSDNTKIADLRERFLKMFSDKVSGFQINGSLQYRISHNLNLSIQGIDADELLSSLPEIALSSGAACSSVSMEPSHVLLAMGLTVEEVASSIRISFGRNNTLEDIDTAVERLATNIKKLRRMKY